MRIFDSHFHIIDPHFPLVENNGFLPADFTVDDYLQQSRQLNIAGGAVVSGSFQAFDQGYLLAALKQLGPSFVGVTQLAASATDTEILALHQAGVRALRFNLKRGGSENIQHIETMAQRVAELAGWHVELYVDAHELNELYPRLLQLPRISIDHLGLSAEGFATLLKLIDNGARVKASGFGRVDFDVVTAMQQIVSVNPDALMFGTDLPCTRAPRPFQPADIEVITQTFDAAQCDKIFYRNASDWYRLAH